jgi:hypothetical protein
VHQPLSVNPAVTRRAFTSVPTRPEYDPGKVAGTVGAGLRARPNLGRRAPSLGRHVGLPLHDVGLAGGVWVAGRTPQAVKVRVDFWSRLCYTLFWLMQSSFEERN